MFYGDFRFIYTVYKKLGSEKNSLSNNKNQFKQFYILKEFLVKSFDSIIAIFFANTKNNTDF